MQKPFDAYQFLHYLRQRSRFIVLVCLAAGALALIVSLLLPKEYTATTSVLIDVPAGNDLRTSIAVSPVYLESLRAYELFASSDTLFLRALEKFHLRDPQSPSPIESEKRRILKVTKLRDTKILQIAVTLPDPKQALAFAQFLADEMVALSRSANRENDRDLLDEAQKQFDEARKRLENEQTAWREFSVREPVDSLRAEIETQNGLIQRLRRDLADSRSEVAELTGRGDDARAAGLRARVQSLEKQSSELQREIDATAVQLSRREARADELQQRLRSAQTAYDAGAMRLRDLNASVGLRGERLRVMDPGLAPERPSSPNIGLNVLLALAVALVVCGAYLTLTFHPARS